MFQQASEPEIFEQKLLYTRNVWKKHLFPHPYVRASKSLYKVQTFLLHRLGQVTLSEWLAKFEAKFQTHSAFNYFGTEHCAGFHQFNLKVFGGCLWRVSNYLTNKVLFSSVGKPWSATPFSVLESTRILVFHDCMVPSILLIFICFAIRRTEKFKLLTLPFQTIFFMVRDGFLLFFNFWFWMIFPKPRSSEQLTVLY